MSRCSPPTPVSTAGLLPAMSRSRGQGWRRWRPLMRIEALLPLDEAARARLRVRAGRPAHHGTLALWLAVGGAPRSHRGGELGNGPWRRPSAIGLV